MVETKEGLFLVKSITGKGTRKRDIQLTMQVFLNT